MGWNYHPEWVPSGKFTGIYHGFRHWSEYLSFAQRKAIYLSSKFALGFQSEENILAGHVSQRIFEGLAYGCIVFSESGPACQQTEGIVQCISSKESLEERMEYFGAHPDEVLALQQRGYDFIRRAGTNNLSVGLFHGTIRSCFGVDIFKALDSS